MIKQGTVSSGMSLTNNSSVESTISLNQDKHIRAMVRANELLSEDIDVPKITDALNCGKFNVKLLAELKNTFLR